MIKKKWVLFFVVIAMVVPLVAGVFVASRASAPKSTPVIVIDAGHGGKDGGAVGRTTDVTESSLNLEYAKTLKNICEEFGYKVVMTRSDMGGLYSPFAQNKKRSEMEKREQIIQGSNADLVVSMHMNSFSSSEARGAQVYYAEGSQAGEELASSVQTSLNASVDYAKKTSKVGDFYVLNCTQTPSILVECGFLSNPEEELLLQQEEYRNDFCYHLFCGILKYMNFN